MIAAKGGRVFRQEYTICTEPICVGPSELPPTTAQRTHPHTATHHRVEVNVGEVPLRFVSAVRCAFRLCEWKGAVPRQPSLAAQRALCAPAAQLRYRTCTILPISIISGLSSGKLNGAPLSALVPLLYMQAAIMCVCTGMRVCVLDDILKWKVWPLST